MSVGPGLMTCWAASLIVVSSGDPALSTGDIRKRGPSVKIKQSHILSL